MTVGIDLGTTNSGIAFLDGGRLRLVPNRNGSYQTPSVIGWDANNRLLIGQAARNQQEIVPGRVVSNVKRYFGRRTLIDTDLGAYAPEEIATVILRRLRRDALAYGLESIHHAVITVPAHYDFPSRVATVESGLAAGFQKIHLLNEPTAAAIPYLQTGQLAKRLLVFDFGGGTTDITALEHRGDELLVRATLGEGALGGIDLDAAILDGLIAGGRIPHLAGLQGYAGRARITARIESTKIALSTQESAVLRVPFVGGVGEGLRHIEQHVTRKQIETWIEPLVQRAVDLAVRVAGEAGYGQSGVQQIILSGGSSEIPLVRSLLRQRFGSEILDSSPPLEVVLSGSAIFGSWVDRNPQSVPIREVLGSTIAVETERGGCVTFVPRNVTLPVVRKRRFTTVENDQGTADIHVVQGESSVASENRTLTQLRLDGLPPGTDGPGPEITVAVKVDAGGMLSVAARDGSGASKVVASAVAWNGTTGRALESEPGPYLKALRRRLVRIIKNLNAGPDVISELQMLVDVADRALSGERESEGITLLESALEQIVQDRMKGWSKGAAN